MQRKTADVRTVAPRARALATLLLGLLVFAPALLDAQGYSLRFFGNGVAAPGLDRVEIALDGPPRPVDVGVTDLTVELWLRAEPGANAAASCQSGNDGWIFGNIFLDRDVFNQGDYGDFGMSLGGGRVAFGAANSAIGDGVCSTTAIDDGLWHHVAAARRASDGAIWLWVDGQLEATTSGVDGDLSYRDNRPTVYAKDPFLVLGAEKHDAGAQFPSFNGWIDELRLSTALRYSGDFPPPSAPFATDATTAALYHFDEGSGTDVGDSSSTPGGPSDGVLYFGGTPAGPLWSTATPFAAIFVDGFESGNLSSWSAAVP